MLPGEEPLQAFNSIRGERRGSIRFPLAQHVSYKILDSRGGFKPGTGTTVDISSGGVLFVAGEELPSGKRVELSIQWPANLESGCGLKLVTTGRVVRVENGRVAVRIDRYEFRTRRAGAPVLSLTT